MTDEQMGQEIKQLKEKAELLAGKIELLLIISGKESQEIQGGQAQPALVPTKKYSQINTPCKFDKAGKVIENGKTYLCSTPAQKAIFAENNPGVVTEIIDNLDMTDEQAASYLLDPENIKQFTEKKASL